MHNNCIKKNNLIYISKDELVGLDKIAVPNKHATDEDWKEVYKKLGSPETADAYKYSLPEDHQVPEDTLKSFSESNTSNCMDFTPLLTS